ncbi:hypothetical protein CVT24_002634 [Panaeolus cyanescens]|uniref:CCAAT-binding factor domain-containing protein n=1 Tax=Panaeolus cyanescens TaxID=181874 RepID=A0A409YU14_9AGAR|nr:hypothetical protein CVT24_002634 [Panaeolus cyanescens]
MGRLRTEKGQSKKQAASSGSHPTQHQKTAKAEQSTKKGTSGKAKGKDIGAFGATKDDIALLKDVGDGVVSGTVNKDPTLANDVSKFLKELNLRPGTPPREHLASPNKGKGKEKEKEKSKEKGKERAKEQVQSTPNAKAAHRKDKSSQSSKPGKDKDKKSKSAKTDTQPAQAKPEPPKEEAPKVVLPTKVTFTNKSHFVFQPISRWYSALPALKPDPSGPSITPTQLSQLYDKAASMHTADIATFQTSSSANSSTSEVGFLSKIIQSGTLSDRLSALTLLVQSSPVHNVRALEMLRGMGERGKGKGGREESLKALRCVVDWWVGGGAPDRKLKYFRDQPLLNPEVTDEYLVMWYFEDWLKKYFFSVLQILETLSLDPLPYVRTQTINLLLTLLKDKPEQEQNLLRLLVNKLGDTEKTICSRASYHLLQLLQAHPSMKAIVVREIIALVLKPAATSAAASLPTADSAPANKHIRFDDDEPKPKAKSNAKDAEKKAVNSHARYYATVTFNQIVLTPGDREVALTLIDIYFEMFKELLGEGSEEKDEEEDGGVGEEREVRKDKKGRVFDGRKGKKKKNGKDKEVKGAAGFTEVEDANSKLVSAILTGVNRALPFAKISAADVGINKHIDTLFLITHKSTFNISLQALVLIQQISASLMGSSTPSANDASSSTAKSISDRYYRTLYASLQDTRLATSSKQAMYLNLLFKSIKADVGHSPDNERIKALLRRFLQVLVSGGSGATEFTAGGLYLLGELFSSVPGLRSGINRGPKNDTEETYDPKKRDPLYAHATVLPLWELTPLVYHYHPAVSLHARQLLSSQPLSASADLSQNTLSHFLDRFVYKNPKKVKEGEGAGGKGASAMQPAASALEGVKLVKGEVADGVMVNEAAFLRKKEHEVPVDQVFFHQYFTRKHEKEQAKKMKKKKGDEEEEDEESDAGSERDDEEEAEVEDDVASEAGSDEGDTDEDEVWRVMKATMPKVDEDDDLLMDSDMDDDEDDIPSGLDEDSELNASDDDDEEDNEDDDQLSLVEGSDDEDLLPMDGLIAYDGSDADDDEVLGEPVLVPDEDEEWGGIGTSEENSKKRKRGETKSERRKKLRSMPTFASYEDYAKMIEDGPEDDI